MLDSRVAQDLRCVVTLNKALNMVHKVNSIIVSQNHRFKLGLLSREPLPSIFML